MKTLREEIEIDAPADKVWGILGEPTAAARYVPGIASARMQGSTRVCVTVDGQEIHEAITDRSDASRSYRYEHVRTPMPVKLSRGRFSVLAAAAGAGSKVVVEAELEAMAPEMEAPLAEMMTAGLRQSLANLRALCEGGS